MLETFPKLGEALTKAMEAQIDIFIVEYDERFFPRATKIVMETMSRGDVATLTAFYGSLLGRKMLASASMKMDGREVIDRALAGKDIDAGVARRQVMRAGLATIAALSPAEQKQVAAMALSPAGQHFRAAMPALVALQVELANSPGPKFVAGSKAAMAAAMKRVTEEDAAGTPKP